MRTHRHAKRHAGEGSDLLYFNQIVSAGKKKTKAEPKLASVKLFVFHIFILFPFFKFSGMEENIVLLK